MQSETRGVQSFGAKSGASAAKLAGPQPSSLKIDLKALVLLRFFFRFFKKSRTVPLSYVPQDQKVINVVTLWTPRSVFLSESLGKPKI